MKKLLMLLLALLLCFACSEDGEDGEDKDGPKKTKRLITGLCQKGPCFKDGDVLIYPLIDGEMDQTGEHFFGYTTDYFGRYEIPALVAEQYVEVSFKGTCHNELTGGEGIQELDGIVDVSDDIKNINPLTKIRSAVARDLFKKTFGNVGECLTEAERLILLYLQMPELEKKFTEMNLESAGIHDAVLSLINAMILYERSEAEQGDYIVSIAQGVVANDQALKDEIATTIDKLPLITIKENLKARYLELGLDTNVPPIWRLGAPAYYADILERDPVIQISHNMDLTATCNFDQSTFNVFALPVVFPAEILTSRYISLNYPIDSQVSIWTKSEDAFPVPGIKLQDLTALKEVMINPKMTYNGMFDADNMPTPGTEYYLVIRRDDDFALTKSCEGPTLPFGQVLASDDEMVSWIGPNITTFFTRDIKYFTIN